MAMFRISARKRRGMSVIASATSRSKAVRVMTASDRAGGAGGESRPRAFSLAAGSLLRRGFGLGLRFGCFRPARFALDRCVKVALVGDGAVVVTRVRRTAHAASVQDLDVRRQRP